MIKSDNIWDDIGYIDKYVDTQNNNTALNNIVDGQDHLGQMRLPHSADTT